MNTEAFKLARATLRKAVREYGWKHASAIWHGTARGYRAPLGKFEGEHWAIVHYYEAMMDGFSDEPFYGDDTVDGTPFEVSDLERQAFGFRSDTAFVVIWHSDQGFETLEEMTADEYDKARERYDSAGEEDEAC